LALFCFKKIGCSYVATFYRQASILLCANLICLTPAGKSGVRRALVGGAEKTKKTKRKLFFVAAAI
jgi:hypothetical protein